jgi:hypothetical protein
MDASGTGTMTGESRRTPVKLLQLAQSSSCVTLCAFLAPAAHGVAGVSQTGAATFLWLWNSKWHTKSEASLRFAKFPIFRRLR